MDLPLEGESPFIRALKELLVAWREAEPGLESLLVRMVGGDVLITPRYRPEKPDDDIIRQLRGLGYYD